MGNRGPGTTIDLWIKNHVIPDKQQLLAPSTTKKGLNDIFKIKVSSAEQLYKTTGEQFCHLQLRRLSYDSRMKQNLL